jgi:hypothetical protein
VRLRIWNIERLYIPNLVVNWSAFFAGLTAQVVLLAHPLDLYFETFSLRRIIRQQFAFQANVLSAGPPNREVRIETSHKIDIAEDLVVEPMVRPISVFDGCFPTQVSGDQFTGFDVDFTTF